MKTKRTSFVLSASIVSSFLFIQNAWARGGGGGSGGGGGGGGGAGGSGGGSPYISIIWLIVVVSVLIYSAYKRKKKLEATRKIVETAELGDQAWGTNNLENRVKEVFDKFQQDWSNFNVEGMKEYLSEQYLKRMVLELNVLKNEGRQNIMENPLLKRVTIFDAQDDADNSKDTFTAEIYGQATDILFDTKNNKQLFSDKNPFTEYWTFVRDGQVWKLDLIKQKTEVQVMRESAIEEFSNRNNFYYDPDFGWLMMPDKGAIFSRTSFKTSDINNHVVGLFRDKIVEFFTYIPGGQQQNNLLSANYIVAQTVIPKQYNDILVRRKRKFFNFGPRKLRRVQTESNDFEGKFCIWADQNDQVSSLELLTPNFMEKVYVLPFELNIEVVGNFLYLYAKSRKDINYDQMLEILSWAFDEMER